MPGQRMACVLVAIRILATLEKWCLLCSDRLGELPVDGFDTVKHGIGQRNIIGANIGLELFH